jgi:hypothetical protein
MRFCKRSVLAIAMLVIISMPLGLFMYWKVQQWIVRHEMMEKLEHAQLQTIEIPASDVKWHEKDREIVVKGKLFDVISQSQVPGTGNIRFTGLFDEAETELEYKTGRLLREKEKNDDSRKLIVQAVWLLSCPLPGPPAIAELNADTEISYNAYITGNFPVADLSIPAPPPKS